MARTKNKHTEQHKIHAQYQDATYIYDSATHVELPPCYGQRLSFH